VIADLAFYGARFIRLPASLALFGGAAPLYAGVPYAPRTAGGAALAAGRARARLVAVRVGARAPA
jgi:hypothetical protein